MNIGDRFRCKRRGHEIEVEHITTTEGAFDSIVSIRNVNTGRRTRIKQSRLMKPYRFEALVLMASTPQELVKEGA